MFPGLEGELGDAGWKAFHREAGTFRKSVRPKSIGKGKGEDEINPAPQTPPPPRPHATATALDAPLEFSKKGIDGARATHASAPLRRRDNAPRLMPAANATDRAP